MGNLVRTWFAPFKQTYAGGSKGAIGVQLRAAVDSFISRIIGFIVRSILLITGAICSIFVLLTGLIFMVVWALIPLLPVISLSLLALGVGA